MRSLRILTIAAVALWALAGVVTPSDAAKCIKAGGQGTGLGEQVAKNMADIALADAVKAYGGKASGKVAYKCDMALVIATCTASQKACK